MNFFRNPEIKRTLFLYGTAFLLFCLAGFSLGTSSGILVAVSSLFFLCLFLCTTYLRYRKLAKLAMDLDYMLHHQVPIPFEHYAEGELSILQNELSKMTLRLTEQSDALARDKKYLSDAMADISHQLRSPLTSIHLILSLLGESDIPPQRRMELLQELSQLLSRMDWLVESMLKMSKMDAGTAYLKQESIPVAKLVAQSSEPLLIPMELREQTLEIRWNTGTEQYTGDLSWSVEAFLNILKNCMEHTPRGGTITITALENTLFTELLIEDNGPGFSKKDLPHLFERFYKGNTSNEQSVGIGLALARMIISQQNGTIKAENRPSGGARFTVKFYK